MLEKKHIKVLNDMFEQLNYYKQRIQDGEYANGVYWVELANKNQIKVNENGSILSTLEKEGYIKMIEKSTKGFNCSHTVELIKEYDHN